MKTLSLERYNSVTNQRENQRYDGVIEVTFSGNFALIHFGGIYREVMVIDLGEIRSFELVDSQPN